MQEEILQKYSKYLQQEFQIRNSCDYDDFYIVSKQEAEEQSEQPIDRGLS